MWEVSVCIQFGDGKQHEYHPVWVKWQCESKIQTGERFLGVLPDIGTAYVIEACAAAEHVESGGAVGRL